MGLAGKLVSQINVKVDGDILHEIFAHRPHQMAVMCPSILKRCELSKGERGTVGSVVVFNFTHDGKEIVSKEMIEAIDEKKRSVTYKVMEGNLMEIYKSFKWIVQVDTNGDNTVVTWTLDYDKLNEDVPAPQTLLDVCLQVTKNMETHWLTNTVTN